MGCNGPTHPSFKLVILLISVVYPAFVYLRLISMLNCFRLSISPEIENKKEKKTQNDTTARAGTYTVIWPFFPSLFRWQIKWVRFSLSHSSSATGKLRRWIHLNSKLDFEMWWHYACCITHKDINLASCDYSWKCRDTEKVGWALLEGWNPAARCAALQRKRLGVITVKHGYSVIFGSATGEGKEETGKEEKNGTDDVAGSWASCSEMTKMTSMSDTAHVTFTLS